MTLPRTVADVLDRHVTFEIESIDRMYLNVYQPRLQYPKGAAAFFHYHRGHTFASSALMAPMTKAFVQAVHDFVDAQGLDLVSFTKGQRKDDLTQCYLAEHDGSEAVLYVGRAQEKASVMRTERRYDRRTGASYAWLVKASALVNHFYFYCFDDDFGPFFIKFCSYFPYNAKLCINGHEWAKRQAAKKGIAFTALDNGFATVEDPAKVQAICDRLGPRHIDALLRKWLRRLPHPFTPADRRAGYLYDISVLQAEFSLTQMLDKPVTGRIFFEQVIRDNLDLGRPDKVSLIFGRRRYLGRKRATPGTFRTRIINSDVTPSLHVDYKSATIKQYHKEGRALRTEMTINNPGDFEINKGLANLPAMRKVGFHANRRLLQRRTPQPRSRHRSRSIRRRHRSHQHRRSARRRPTLRRPPSPGTTRRTAHLPVTAARVHQRRPAQPPRTNAGHQPGLVVTRPRHLRPATTTTARPHRTHPAHPPLPRHRTRATSRHVPHPSPQQTPPQRRSPTHRSATPSTRTATRSSPLLRHSTEPTHTTIRPRRLKFDRIKTTSSSKAL
jgi:hypothetical protein